ncbi:hypothetical protein F5146DRAFT_995441 [Armillaria mellea]|nr:hypothetical protein F5146DRAFT_995441 [Armillaria mellea]
MYSGLPPSEAGSDIPVGQHSDNAVVSHRPYYATRPNEQNTLHYVNYGYGAERSTNYTGGTQGSMPAYGLPVFLALSYPQLYKLPDPAPYIRELVQIPPNAPIHLSSLIDEPARQCRTSYSMKQLAAVAIYSSQDGKAMLQEIAFAIKARFEYFRTDSRFLATLKSTLSVNHLFKSVKYSPNEPVGNGGFWVVDVSNPTGHRTRKRGNPSRTGDDTNSEVSN